MPENTDSRGRHGFDREAVRMVKEPLVLLEHLALGRHSRIIKWSLAVLVIALVGLVMTRAFSAGDIFAVDMTQAVNISIQLFAIINPLVALPTFIFYTEGMQARDRHRIVNTTIMMVIALVASFAFFGQLILRGLQVTVDSFELGGGILLMVIAIDMLGGTVRTKTFDTQQMAIVPLATPLLVGPGTMTTRIVLTNTQHLVNVLLGGLVAAVAVYMVLRFSKNIMDLVGRNGVTAGSRLMSIVLAAVAASMIHGALRAWGMAL